MDKQAFTRTHGLALSAAVVPLLLVAALLLAGSAQSAAGCPGGLADSGAPPSAYPLPQSTNLTIVSDTSTEYLSGTGWEPAVLAWTYSGWPTLQDARWIWKSYLVTPEEARNGSDIVTLRRKFSLPRDARDVNGIIRITADNAYELSLNGTIIGQDGTPDPSGTDYGWRSIETYQLNGQPGENQLVIRAINYKSDTAHDNPYLNPAGVLFRAEITYEIPNLSVLPTTLPADGTSMSTVTLLNTHPGHRIRFISSRGSLDTFTPGTGTTDANGRFVATVRSSTPGTAVITAQDLTTGQTLPASAKVTFTPVGGEQPPEPPVNERPVAIVDVHAQHPLDGRYLEGIPVRNRIGVTVDWKGTLPGHVDFILNDVVYHETATGPVTYHEFDMGRDLQPWTNRLRIIAYSDTGLTSHSRDFAPWSTPMPVWVIGLKELGLGSLPLFASGDLSGKAHYELGFRLPPHKFDIAAPGFGVPDGDTRFGAEFAGKLSIPLFCLGPYEASVSGGAEKGFKFLRAKIEGKVTGKVEAQPIGLCVWEWPPHGSVSVKVEATRNIYRKPVLVMIAYFNASLGVFVEQTVAFLHIEAQVSKILGEFYIDGKVNIRFESDLDFPTDMSPYFQFRNLGVEGGIGAEGGYRYNLPIVEIKAWAGAEGSVKFVRMGPIDVPSIEDFDSITLKGEVGVRFRKGWFEKGRTAEIQWQYPPTAQSMDTAPHDSSATDWHLIGHTSGKDYALFQARSDTTQAFAQNATSQGESDIAVRVTANSILVSNVYTYTEPSLAFNPADDSALLLWVHDDVDKPLGQNFDLAYSHWDGSTWSTPARVTDDTYLDGGPQVICDGSGNGLAVWERLNDPALPITATLDTTTTGKIEIAWAQYDPTSDTWSVPAWLSTNTALDHKPALARNSAGDVLAVWRQNPAGLLSGNSADPDRVMFAAWDGAGWITPTVAVEDIPGLVDLAAGYGDGQATIAYTRFLTPTGSITPSLQLFSSTWDGSTWSPPQQRTDDDLGHTNLQVVYDNLNQPLLVWQAGEALRLRNLTTGAEVDLALDPDLVIDEFRLLHDAADNPSAGSGQALAAVFTGQQAGQRDLFVAFYDAPHNTWGRPYRLTNDVHSEGYPAPVLDSAGRLLMAYAQTQITSEERTMTDPDTGEVITFTLPVEGQTDLYTLSHQFVQDLAMGALTVSNTHPQPGASVTVSATVTNTGALALDGVQVGFYEGDPDAGGTLIDTVTLPGTLAAGYTATLTTTYTVPLAGGQRQLVAVADPQDQIAEVDETNNRASLIAFGPDLELAGASVDYWSGSGVGLMALIHNIGTIASPTMTIAYHWEAITGTLAVTDTVPPLEAGAAITLTTPWDYGALAQGSYPLAAVVNEGEGDFTETFTANNETLLALEVLPDLAVSPLYLWTEALPDARVIITATVYNFGSVASPPAEVAIYVDEALTDTTRIGVISLPALDPAGHVEITTTWDTPTWGERAFYVAVDPGRAVTETTWANNLASVSGASACTALQGDVNCSCTVDVADVQEVANHWRQDAEPPYDLDDDKRVTVVDIQQTASNWLASCP